MANTVRVDVRMSPDFEEKIMGLPQVKSAVTSEAKAIAARANGMASEKSGVWHEVGEEHDPSKVGGTWHGPFKGREETATIGGKDATYSYKPARRTGEKGVPLAIVFPTNYAGYKDNHKNNTLLKAKD